MIKGIFEILQDVSVKSVGFLLTIIAFNIVSNEDLAGLTEITNSAFFFIALCSFGKQYLNKAESEGIEVFQFSLVFIFFLCSLLSGDNWILGALIGSTIALFNELELRVNKQFLCVLLLSFIFGGHRVAYSLYPDYSVELTYLSITLVLILYFWQYGFEITCTRYIPIKKVFYPYLAALLYVASLSLPLLLFNEYSSNLLIDNVFARAITIFIFIRMAVVIKILRLDKSLINIPLNYKIIFSVIPFIIYIYFGSSLNMNAYLSASVHAVLFIFFDLIYMIISTEDIRQGNYKVKFLDHIVLLISVICVFYITSSFSYAFSVSIGIVLCQRLLIIRYKGE